MLIRLPGAWKGWKVTTVGEDIAWIKPHADGRLYVHQPEAAHSRGRAPRRRPTPQ